MKRNLGKLADELFDILVVGGGIHGAAIVREAADRGFKAALIEQGDFGQATSSNSQKIIHGGLRYLQQVDFKRMRQSITARRMVYANGPSPGQAISVFDPHLWARFERERGHVHCPGHQ